MSVYIGPCNYGTPETDSDDRFIRADEPPRGGELSGKICNEKISIEKNLDMKHIRIINQESENNRYDAATVGYVSDWVGRLNSSKVDWTGGTMTGDLNMGMHKLKQPGHPEDRIVQHTKPYDFRRYIVFPHADRTKTFHVAGSKRNINIESNRELELFNGGVLGSSRSLDSTSISVPGKEKEMFHLDSFHDFSVSSEDL